MRFDVRKKLLGDAAKAAGYFEDLQWITHEIEDSMFGINEEIVPVPKERQHFRWKNIPRAVWDPLHDSEDAFKLMVACRLFVGADEVRCWAWAEKSEVVASESFGKDANAVYRKVIVFAAAKKWDQRNGS